MKEEKLLLLESMLSDSTSFARLMIGSDNNTFTTVVESLIQKEYEIYPESLFLGLHLFSDKIMPFAIDRTPFDSLDKNSIGVSLWDDYGLKEIKIGNIKDNKLVFNWNDEIINKAKEYFSIFLNLNN